MGVAAIINSSPDVVDLLRLALERAGIIVVTTFTYAIREGEIDLDRFIRQHEPRVIVYDLAPPYDSNWRLFEHVHAMPVMEGRFFVLTAMNVEQAQKLAGAEHRIHEIVGKSEDLDEIVFATREAMRARPTR